MDNLHIKAGLTENDRQSFLEQLLQKIIDVDAEAQKMTEKAENLRTNAESELEKKKRAFEESYRLLSEKELEIFRAKTAADSEKKLSEFARIYVSQKERLQKAASDNHERWVNEIFGFVTEE
ncbi:MAG: hypothetical protein PUB08_04675 [Firmicutes bacterium]|nr:hypothetical protein [Bacillota bacterium]